MSNALIIFTRVPIPGQTKTRLMPFLSGKECAELHSCFIRDTYAKAKQIEADIFVYYTPEEEREVLFQVFEDEVNAFPQFGEDLGERMKRAIGDVLRMGYNKVLLIGTDIPHVQTETFEQAFEDVESNEIVIHPTLDGGYYLIGMKKEYDSVWKVKRYGTNTVIHDTLQHMDAEGLKVAVGQTYYDIDDKNDLKQFYADIRNGVVKDCPNTKKYLENFYEKF